MLLIKPETSSRWTYASLNHLPPLELSLFDGNIATSSPPGRSRLPSKRSRSADSPPSSERTTKARVEGTEPSSLEDNPPGVNPVALSTEPSIPMLNVSASASTPSASQVAIDLTMENTDASSHQNHLN